MSNQVPTRDIHHLTLTVTNLRRSCDFYTMFLGFQKVAELGPTRILLSNGKATLAITEPPDLSQAIRGDMFSENRVGLDHLSFSVENRAALTEAMALFDQQGIPHGEIEDMPGMGLSMLAFRDPDNIQLELTAPYSA